MKAKQEDMLHIIYNGRDEFLKDFVELTSPSLPRDLVNSLVKQSPICPLMHANIKIVKELGAGVYGQVFEISFKNHTAKMALKRMSTILDDPIIKNDTLRHVLKCVIWILMFSRQ